MKRVFLIGIAVFAIPCLIAATPPSAGSDRFVGLWNCVAAGGSAGQMAFKRTRSGLSMRADWKNGGGHSSADHTFTVNSDGGWSTTEITVSNMTTFKGDSPGFDGDTITFTGASQIDARSYPQLEKFRFTSPDSFQHIWYGQNDAGQWQPNGYQECTKVST